MHSVAVSIAAVSTGPSLPHPRPLTTTPVSSRSSSLSFMKLSNWHHWPSLLCTQARPLHWLEGNVLLESETVALLLGRKRELRLLSSETRNNLMSNVTHPELSYNPGILLMMLVLRGQSQSCEHSSAITITSPCHLPQPQSLGRNNASLG